ncbi:hypothetical protein EIN_283660 [Entamoeba invadens IP1]|uniref:Expansin-like EG45 domain-containing protein n=1 Tax=Entamoeba invadens IP1 TaxID=370355 RepID=L7FJS8_ENTIV|nr:hypothetical protein EIN_283660 [Entamoeba invadens IP1]ELP84820.1 hypothetical protein EIN_283660 [Entamoeba invadens IP1]|eukprot:XP_004184166.1 hypothetical protein EIN_283660 [Entamoeba invadens IP1]
MEMLLTFLYMSITMAVNFDVPCMLGMRLEALENIGVRGVVGTRAVKSLQCYADLPHYEKDVYAYSTQSYCLISQALYFQTITNDLVPRCGACIEITGPSMKPITCQLVGSYMVPNATDLTMQYSIPRTFFADRKFVSDVAMNPSTDDSSIVTPVNVRNVQCPFKTYPVLEVYKKNTTHITFKVYNFNSVIYKARINKKTDYVINKDSSFVIPLPVNPVFVQIMSVRLMVVSFGYITDKIGKYYGNTQTPMDSDWDKCQFTPQNVVISNHTSNDNYFEWITSTVPGNTVDTVYPETKLINDSITFNETGKAYLSFRYRVPFKEVFFFSTLKIVSSSSSQYSFDGIDLFTMGKDNPKSAVVSTCDKLVFNKSVTQVGNTYEGIFEFSLKISRCTSFFNTFVIGFTGEPNAVLHFSSITFDETSYKNGLKLCPLGAYQCKQVVCNPTESSPDDGGVVQFTKGCTPFCGVCPMGQVCTTSGVCIVRENKNQRSYSPQYTVLFYLMLITLYIL